MVRRRIPILIALTLIAFVALAFSPARHAQGHKRFEPSIAYVQQNAPVQLVSVTHSMEFLFSKAEVKNISSHTVRSVTFGVLLSEPGKTDFLLASKQEVPTDIKPDSVRTMDVLDFPIKDAQQKAVQFQSPRVTAAFGVLSVRFEDGTTWSFDPLTNGGFVQSPKDDHSARLIHCQLPEVSATTILLDKIISFPQFTAEA